MAIVAADLVAYAAADMPDDDVASSGGAIDLLRYVDFTPITANDTIEAVSDAAGDTQNATIEGRDAAGAVVSETKAMAGVTPIVFSTLGTVERILSFELASVAIGVITVDDTSGGVPLRVIPIGGRGFMRMFRKSASESGATERYEKFFWKNEHGTLALDAAHVDQNADPSSKITHALDATKDASTAVADRTTTPGFTFNDSDKSVPTGALGAGEAIGVWLNLSLLADNAPIKDTYTSELEGTSV